LIEIYGLSPYIQFDNIPTSHRQQFNNELQIIKSNIQYFINLQQQICIYYTNYIHYINNIRMFIVHNNYIINDLVMIIIEYINPDHDISSHIRQQQQQQQHSTRIYSSSSSSSS
jgi:hypothetical protein